MYAMRLESDIVSGSRLLELVADINQSLDVILTTPKNTKIGDPEFGCDVWEYLDKPMTMAPRIIAAAATAIQNYEKRIRVLNIDPEFSQVASGIVTIAIDYTIIDTGENVQHHATISSFSA